MFTGIIEAVGRVAATKPVAGDLRLRIATDKLDLTDVRLGDSIAVNGVCLTVVELPGDGFWADVSNETLAHTNFNQLRSGSQVNLEKALTPSSRLGGHIVSGHVDGIGELLERRDDARSIFFRVKAQPDLARYIASKGSICVDGISLTVNSVNGAEFDLNIVPHTAQETTAAAWQPGHRFNLEVDVIARYLERLLQGDNAQSAKQATGIDQNFLAEHGFF